MQHAETKFTAHIAQHYRAQCVVYVYVCRNGVTGYMGNELWPLRDEKQITTFAVNGCVPMTTNLATRTEYSSIPTSEGSQSV